MEILKFLFHFEKTLYGKNGVMKKFFAMPYNSSYALIKGLNFS